MEPDTEQSSLVGRVVVSISSDSEDESNESHSRHDSFSCEISI